MGCGWSSWSPCRPAPPPHPQPWRPRRWRLGVAVAMVAGARLFVDADEDVFDATDRIMGRITECVAVARRTYPQQPRRRDDGWWVRGPDTAVVRPATTVGVTRTPPFAMVA